MTKSRDAFRTISEVAGVLDTPAHVLRFWESKFSQIKPVKRAGGRRYYRPADVNLLAGIKHLLHDQGMTIKGAQKLLREKGIKHVVAIGKDQLEITQDDAATIDAPAPPPAKPAAPEQKSLSEKPDTPKQEADTPEASNVVAMPTAPANDPAPAETEAEAEAETPANDAWRAISPDPADSDSDAPARLFHHLHKAPRDRLAKQAATIAPLLARMQTLRDRIDIR